MLPLINILIRSSYRPTTFARCIASVQNQTYKNIRVIVSYDDDRALEYIPDWCEKLPVTKSTEPFGYNLYCNDLKAQVKEGWFFFLDDDDRLTSDTVLDDLADELSGAHTQYIDAFIVNFIRGSVIKPNDIVIKKGKIGMPCIVLHYTTKGIADFDQYEDADYRYIKEVFEQTHCLFISLILVRASRRGRGYIEEMAS